MHTRVKLLEGIADVDHTQIIGGDTVKLLGGIYLPIPPGFRHPCTQVNIGLLENLVEIGAVCTLHSAARKAVRYGTFRICVLRTSRLEPYRNSVPYFSSIFEAYRTNVPYPYHYKEGIP